MCHAEIVEFSINEVVETGYANLAVKVSLSL